MDTNIFIRSLGLPRFAGSRLQERYWTLADRSRQAHDAVKTIEAPLAERLPKLADRLRDAVGQPGINPFTGLPGDWTAALMSVATDEEQAAHELAMAAWGAAADAQEAFRAEHPGVAFFLLRPEVCLAADDPIEAARLWCWTPEPGA